MSGGPDMMLEAACPGPVCGVDEAGRGPLAGPVVAGAVLLCKPRPSGLDDSKKLSRERRGELESVIKRRCRWAVGVVDVGEIDRLNIFGATMLAMTRAVAALGFRPAFVLVDGNRCPDWDHQSHAVVGGDALCLSIAAASIVAKHRRDCMMREYDALYPGYGWASNKGYAARFHQEALRTLGPTPLHRRSFAPVAQAELNFGPIATE